MLSNFQDSWTLAKHLYVYEGASREGDQGERQRGARGHLQTGHRYVYSSVLSRIYLLVYWYKPAKNFDVQRQKVSKYYTSV